MSPSYDYQLDRNPGLAPDAPARGSSGQFLVDLLIVLFLAGMTLSKTIFSIALPQRPFWLTAYLVVLVLALRRPDAFLTLLRKNVLLLSWPLLAILSALWSSIPLTSAYNGMQLAMTILIGLTLVWQRGAQKTLRLLFFTFLVVNVASLAYLAIDSADSFMPYGGFRGIYHHKNEMGLYSVHLTLAACCLFIEGYRRILTGISVLLGIAILALTRSGTCLVTLSIVMGLVPLALIYRRGSGFLALALGVEFIAASAIIACVTFFDLDVFGLVLQSVGKDQTLTGRTVLWDFAFEAIDQKPLLGFGYTGWWDLANPNVHFLRYVIGQDLWFFHNSYIEATVGFGFPGLILIVVTLAVAIRRAIVAFVQNPDGPAIWCVVFLAMICIYAMSEHPLFVNHGFNQLLLAVVFAASYQPRRRSAEIDRRPISPSTTPRMAVA